MSGYLRSREGVAGEHSAAIDGLFAEYDCDGSPGVNLAVVRGGRVIHQRGYGVADIEHDVPFSPDTVLRLGSTTKHLCATCVLILEDRGKLTLDDDVRVHLPEVPDFGAPIRLRHLLTMTSGLRDGLNMLLFAGLGVSVPVARGQVLNLLQRETTAIFRPGEDCSYSNTNYALLSEVIERVSGRSLARFMAEEIFEPLGMHDTALVPQMTRTISNAARGYVPDGASGYDAGLMLVELSGDGGVVSTLADMVTWCNAYAQGRPLKNADLRARLEAPNCLIDGTPIEYRLGINVSRENDLLKVSHAGGMPGYLCDFVMFPEHELGIVLLSNVFDPRVFEAPDRIAQIVLGLGPRSVPQTGVDAAAPVGFFANAARETLIELVRRDDGCACFLLGEAHPLAPDGRGGLRSSKRGATVSIRTAGDGVELTLGCLPPIHLTRVGRPGATSDAQLAPYAGRYWSRVLAEYHRIEVVDGILHVRLESPLRTLVWQRFAAVAGDLFTSEIDGEPSLTNVQIGFVRDAGGAVRGLRYSLARCVGVEFERVADAP